MRGSLKYNRFLVMLTMGLALAGNICAQEVPQDGLAVDAQFTYGLGGSSRSSSFVAGDIQFATIKVTGLANTDGHVRFRSHASWLTDKGEVIQAIPEVRFEQPLPFGGTTVSHYLQFPVAHDTTPGRYEVVVKVVENSTGRETSTRLPFDVLKSSTFSAIHIRLSDDVNGKSHAGATYCVGQMIYFYFTATGFAMLDGKVDLHARLSVLDKNGDSTGGTSQEFDVKTEVPRFRAQEVPSIPLFFAMGALRSGEFVLLLDVEDRSAGNVSQHRVPIIVTDPTALRSGEQPVERQKTCADVRVDHP